MRGGSVEDEDWGIRVYSLHSLLIVIFQNKKYLILTIPITCPFNFFLGERVCFCFHASFIPSHARTVAIGQS